MLKKKELIIIGALLVVIGSVVTVHADRRILFIDSYHEGNELSDGVTEGITSTLQGQNVTLKIHHMDTKRNRSEEFIKSAAFKAKRVIDDFKPNIVIASEDNASKYLIVPYFKDSKIPFVFCGVNFSADNYGFPFSNVTGIVDVPPIHKLIYSLKHFHRVTSVGYLAADTLTQRKDGVYMKQNIRERIVERYVDNIEDWKTEFIHLQSQVDVLIIGNNSGIKGWDKELVRHFTLVNTKIPTGCILDWLAPFVFLGAVRNPLEQGAYAASTALKILDGASVSSFPIAENNDTFMIINKKIADILNIKIPKSFLKVAKNVIE